MLPYLEWLHHGICQQDTEVYPRNTDRFQSLHQSEEQLKGPAELTISLTKEEFTIINFLIFAKKILPWEKLFDSDSMLISPSNLRVLMVLFFHFKRWTNKLVKSALTHTSRFNSTTETTDCAKNYQHKKSTTLIGIYNIPKPHPSPQKSPQILHHTLMLFPSLGTASQWHFAAFSHGHSIGTAVRESVCTGTSPTNWGFGFVGLFCFGGERKHQFFL